jgi:hypothetical protein
MHISLLLQPLSAVQDRANMGQLREVIRAVILPITLGIPNSPNDADLLYTPIPRIM